MKKVLITGATGFVGGYIVEAGIKGGYDLHLTLRPSSSTKYIQNLKYTSHYISITDEEEIYQLLKQEQYDFIIHNAGLTKAKNLDGFMKVNRDSIIAFTSAINKLTHKPKFLFTSSLAACGPADDKEDRIITTSSTPTPITYYGKSKLAAEDYLKKHAKFDYNIIRPTAVYGPREEEIFQAIKIIDKGLEVNIGKGSDQLTFIYVKDLADMLWLVLEKGKPQKTYLAANKNTYTSQKLNELIRSNLKTKTLKVNAPMVLVNIAAKIFDVVGRYSKNAPMFNSDKLNELKANSWKCDLRDTINDLDYSPPTPLEDGLKFTINWYRDNNWL